MLSLDTINVALEMTVSVTTESTKTETATTTTSNSTIFQFCIISKRYPHKHIITYMHGYNYKVL